LGEITRAYCGGHDSEHRRVWEHPLQDRHDLGPWLTDPAKLAQWDILCVAKLDQLTPFGAHFDDLRIWADGHGKTIASRVPKHIGSCRGEPCPWMTEAQA
jgi:hypothetical protein